MAIETRAVIKNKIKQTIGQLERQREQVISVLNDRLQREQRQLKQLSVLVAALSPQAILRRGYSIVRVNGQVSDGSNLSSGSIVAIELSKAAFEAAIVRPLEVNNNATEQ